MAVVDFSDVEYRFRYGKKEDLDATSIRERSFNIAYDTGELFVDIMNRRIPINSKLIAMDTEDEIRALVDPEQYIYYAKDTCNLLYYHGLVEGWKICNREEVIFSREAEKDKEGNVITDTYATKTELALTAEEIMTTISNLNRFETIIVDDYDSLPDPGEGETLYFVPDHDIIDPISGETVTYYAQYVWVHDPDADMYYYEKIGVTTPDMKNYYTMIQVDQLIGNLDFGEEKDEVVEDTTFRVLMSDPELLPTVGVAGTIYYVSRVAFDEDTGVSAVVYDKYDWIGSSYEMLNTISSSYSMRNNLVILEASVVDFPTTGDINQVYATETMEISGVADNVATYDQLPTDQANGTIYEVTTEWTNETTNVTYPAGFYRYNSTYAEWINYHGVQVFDKYMWEETSPADDENDIPATYGYVQKGRYTILNDSILT